MYRIDVPEKVEYIIDTLTAAGHEAYAFRKKSTG